jgi:hypothetical protein
MLHAGSRLSPRNNWDHGHGSAESLSPRPKTSNALLTIFRSSALLCENKSLEENPENAKKRQITY